MKKSISVDWLQIYVDATNLQFDKMYKWQLQTYQTKQFRKVYIVSYKNEELCTCVSEPTSKIIPPWAMIVKFSNRQLYGQDYCHVVDCFLEQNNLIYKSITRIDIAADFNYFYNSLCPHSFIDRFVKGTYLKNGRGKFSLIGEQHFQNSYEYLRFGSKTSEINVYLYNKTKELQEVQDKPYIRENWRLSGINENVTVWRLEISIKNKGTEYVDIETGELQKLTYKKLKDTEYLSDIYFSYLDKYFQFKVNDGTKNKSRMKKLQLFDNQPIKLLPIYLPQTTGSNVTDKIFLKKLYQFDQEYRGATAYGISAQKQLIQEFIQVTGLGDYFSKKSETWNKQTYRPE